MSSRFDTADFVSADGDDAASLTIKRDHTNGRVLMRIGEDGPIFVATEDTARIVGGFIRHGDPMSIPAPEPELIECPHWQPGAITMRRGCTACAADQNRSEP